VHTENSETAELNFSLVLNTRGMGDANMQSYSFLHSCVHIYKTT